MSVCVARAWHRGDGWKCACAKHKNHIAAGAISFICMSSVCACGVGVYCVLLRVPRVQAYPSNADHAARMTCVSAGQQGPIPLYTPIDDIRVLKHTGPAKASHTSACCTTSSATTTTTRRKKQPAPRSSSSITTRSALRPLTVRTCLAGH